MEFDPLNWIAPTAAALGALAFVRSRWTEVLIREFEAGVFVRRGRVIGQLPVGRTRYLRRHREVLVFDLRQQLLTLSGQEVLSADGVAIKVSLLLAWKLIDPCLAVRAATDFSLELYAAAQLALRTSAASIDFETLLTDRSRLVEDLRAPLAEEAAKLGIGLQRVAVKDLSVGGELKRALADSARARAEARARIERARGEAAALRSLTNAARLMKEHEGLYQLSLLETARAVSEGQQNTLVLGVDPQRSSSLPRGGAA